ncbi:hypothetical protein ACLOJK_035154 [Asimina triloba]
MVETCYCSDGVAVAVDEEEDCHRQHGFFRLDGVDGEDRSAGSSHLIREEEDDIDGRIRGRNHRLRRSLLGTEMKQMLPPLGLGWIADRTMGKMLES